MNIPFLRLIAEPYGSVFLGWLYECISNEGKNRKALPRYVLMRECML